MEEIGDEVQMNCGYFVSDLFLSGTVWFRNLRRTRIVHTNLQMH